MAGGAVGTILVGREFADRFGRTGGSGNPLVPGGGSDIVPGNTGNQGTGGLGGSDPLGLTGDCPGLFEVKIGNRCVDLTALPPGGDPATKPIPGDDGSGGPGMALPDFSNGPQGQAVHGRFGLGEVPRVDVMTVRRCPAGMALGKDGICYDGLHRNSPKRAHPMGMKPLLTSGDRAAIRQASAAAGKLARSKKSLKKAAKALEKAGG